MFMIYATAHNNSGQLNPAVTIALVAAGVAPIAQALVNIAAQARHPQTRL
jgi:glycerol uptake facilitator-like aquaporin